MAFALLWGPHRGSWCWGATTGLKGDAPPPTLTHAEACWETQLQVSLLKLYIYILTEKNEAELCDSFSLLHGSRKVAEPLLLCEMSLFTFCQQLSSYYATD